MQHVSPLDRIPYCHAHLSWPTPKPRVNGGVSFLGIWRCQPTTVVSLTVDRKKKKPLYSAPWWKPFSKYSRLNFEKGKALNKTAWLLSTTTLSVYQTCKENTTLGYVLIKIIAHTVCKHGI